GGGAQCESLPQLRRAQSVAPRVHGVRALRRSPGRRGEEEGRGGGEGLASMRRIALDAMGGDHAPEPELDAAGAVSREGRKGLGLILVGDEARIRDGLARRGASPTATLAVHHASEVIRMDDSPSTAVRGKKDSSMRVCFDLVRAGAADAAVSAGNSGA